MKGGFQTARAPYPVDEEAREADEHRADDPQKDQDADVRADDLFRRGIPQADRASKSARRKQDGERHHEVSNLLRLLQKPAQIDREREACEKARHAQQKIEPAVRVHVVANAPRSKPHRQQVGEDDKYEMERFETQSDLRSKIEGDRHQKDEE